MITDQPALVSTSAAVAPAGPVPITTASQSRDSGTPAHLVVGVPTRLHVAVRADDAPARELGIAAVLGRAVRAFARVVVQHRAEFVPRAQPPVLFVGVDRAEVGAERGDALAIDRLPAARRAVELALGNAERAFDARAPRELLVR